MDFCDQISGVWLGLGLKNERFPDRLQILEDTNSNSTKYISLKDTDRTYVLFDQFTFDAK